MKYTPVFHMDILDGFVNIVWGRINVLQSLLSKSYHWKQIYDVHYSTSFPFYNGHISNTVSIKATAYNSLCLMTKITVLYIWIFGIDCLAWHIRKWLASYKNRILINERNGILHKKTFASHARKGIFISFDSPASKTSIMNFGRIRHRMTHATEWLLN